MHLPLKFHTLATCNCDTQDGMMLEFGVDLINSHGVKQILLSKQSPCSLTLVIVLFYI